MFFWVTPEYINITDVPGVHRLLKYDIFKMGSWEWLESLCHSHRMNHVCSLSAALML